MHEDLLGYLLDALDDAERERIERAIRTDPELQRRLEALKEELSLLAEEPDGSAPPPGLAARTCDLVEAFQSQRRSEDKHPRQPRSGSAQVGVSPRARAELTGTRRTLSVADTVVTAGIFLAAAFLFVPAIANSRFRSEITACQYNLQRLGDALNNYTDKRGGELPPISVTGNRAAAGVFASQLMRDQLLTETGWLVCPGSHLAQNRIGWFVPTLEQLDAAEGRWLMRLQRSMGGSYGYTLGHIREGHYYTPLNEHRTYFALLADAPSQHLPGHQSANHGGRGQNVLFEDGHVEFICSCRGGLRGDAFFLNRAGFTEAGLDKDDSVIVPSETAPLVAWE